MESQPGSPRGRRGGQKVSLPSREMEKLALLVGYWSIVETTADTNSGSSTRGSCSLRAGPGALSLILDQVIEAPERTYVVHGILSWESGLDCYRLCLADSRIAGLHILSGFCEGADLQFWSGSEAAAGKLWERVRLSEIGSDFFTMTIQSSETVESRRRIIQRYARKNGS
jgi:hypothetical protein